MPWRLYASAGCLFSVVLISASCLVTHTLHGNQAGRLDDLEVLFLLGTLGGQLWDCATPLPCSGGHPVLPLLCRRCAFL